MGRRKSLLAKPSRCHERFACDQNRCRVGASPAPRVTASALVAAVVQAIPFSVLWTYSPMTRGLETPWHRHHCHHSSPHEKGVRRPLKPQITELSRADAPRIHLPGSRTRHPSMGSHISQHHLRHRLYLCSRFLQRLCRQVDYHSQG